jgi:chemotaxis protein methyltransferase CheR
MAHQIDQTLAILRDVMNAHTAVLAGEPAPRPRPAVSSTADPRAALAMRLLTQIEERFGLDVNRTTAEKLVRVIEPIKQVDLPGYVGLLEQVPSDHREWILLMERFTVGETYFMRDPDQLEFFCRMLPPLVEQAARACAFTLRFWSIGCSSGEEAFTLAVLVLRVLCATGNAVERVEAITPRRPWKVEVLGSDLSRHALAQAQRATYETGPLSSFRAELGDLDRFFPAVVQGPGNGSTQLRTVHPCVRSMVEFRPFNLLSDPMPAGEFDAVLCRNVLVHFSNRARQIAHARLADAVRPGGLLLLGPTDRLAKNPDFETLWSPGAVIHQRRRRG